LLKVYKRFLLDNELIGAGGIGNTVGDVGFHAGDVYAGDVK